MAKLNDAKLKAWLRAGKSISGKSDGAGLTFTCSAVGTASWVLRYRLAGKQREMTLGNYPDLSLMDARRAATAARARVDGGVDVASEKRHQKLKLSQAGTFRQLAEDYMLRAAPRLSVRSQKEARRYLDKDILPRLGHLPAEGVTSADVVAMVERIAVRSDSVARRNFERVSVIFSHGVAKHIVRAHPCAGLKLSAILGERPKKRARIKLSEDELRKFLAAIPTLGPINELALRVLLATCVRKGELLRAQWPHVDMEQRTWTIPDENSKSGTGFTIPLPPTVVEWLAKLKKLSDGNPWLVPSQYGGRVSKTKPMSESTLNAILDRLDCDIRRITPHDLRSTARSYLSALGVDLIVAERCLNHSLGGLVAIYDQHDYLTERRRALELWAAFLTGAEQVKPWNVTPIKYAA